MAASGETTTGALAPAPLAPERRRTSPWLVVGAAGTLVLSLVACGSSNRGGSGEGSAAASAPAAATSGAAPTTAGRAALFDVTHDWGSIVPATFTPIGVKTLEDCQDHAQDVEGRRAPLVVEDPPVVTLDGSCNVPLDQPTVGLHQQADYGSNPISVQSGTPAGVECAVTDGRNVNDVRGYHASKVWLGVVLHDGRTGFINEVNTGFFDETTVRPCP